MSKPIYPKPYIDASEMSHVLQWLLKQPKLILEEDTALIVYDLTFIENRITVLKQTFPSNTFHTIALKANPLISVLKKIALLGVGVEVASLPELKMAEAAGFDAARIVFDSPAKTVEELRYALLKGIRINADSFEELERIDTLLMEQPSDSIVGVRINPQAGHGTILSTSVAGEISKFGIPLNDNYLRLKESFQKYPWLQGVHVHIGSQGCPIQLLVNGTKKVVDFAIDVSRELKLNGLSNRISTIDIGGGLPANYHQLDNFTTIQDYHDLLRQAIPTLFECGFSIITEFGRHIHANSGCVVSKVEYVKHEPGHHMAMIHVGADLFLRKSYNPADWHHTISVADSEGRLKTGIDSHKYWIAGPLCFSGDLLAKEIELPKVEAGDYILIHDTGAYTLSMWSRYNSRQIPKVIGYKSDSRQYEILKKRESPEDLIHFWS